VEVVVDVAAEAAVQKKTIEVFEPAMCCSTGVCGPDVPQELVSFSADVDWVRRNGAEVYRYNLASTPVAFTNRAEVLDFMTVSGSQGLPLVLVDGKVAMAGRYPDRADLARWVGRPVPAAMVRSLPLAATDSTAGDSCCGGGQCC
jgi:arsenite-transporting ATPase